MKSVKQESVMQRGGGLFCTRCIEAEAGQPSVGDDLIWTCALNRGLKLMTERVPSVSMIPQNNG